jgi:hypothetical protein
MRRYCPLEDAPLAGDRRADRLPRRLAAPGNLHDQRKGYLNELDAKSITDNMSAAHQCIALTACGGDDDNDSNTEATVTAAPNEESSPAAEVTEPPDEATEA